MKFLDISGGPCCREPSGPSGPHKHSHTAWRSFSVLRNARHAARHSFFGSGWLAAGWLAGLLAGWPRGLSGSWLSGFRCFVILRAIIRGYNHYSLPRGSYHKGFALHSSFSQELFGRYTFISMLDLPEPAIEWAVVRMTLTANECRGIGSAGVEYTANSPGREDRCKATCKYGMCRSARWQD